VLNCEFEQGGFSFSVVQPKNFGDHSLTERTKLIELLSAQRKNYGMLDNTKSLNISS